jgi:signal transduction histidine kinase
MAAGIQRAVRVLALLFLVPAPSGALAQEPVAVLEDARFVLSDARQPPGDDAPWRPVRLPDNWYFSHPAGATAGWYRLEFELAPGPFRNHLIYLPRNSARHIRFFVNGRSVSDNSAYTDPGARSNWVPPALFHVSWSYLNPGRNVLHVRVEAVPQLRQGLTRVTVGPANIVRARFELHHAIQVTSLLMFGAAALLAGLLAGAFWLRERKDATLAWYGITAFAWALIAMPWGHGAFAPSQFSHGALAFVGWFAYAAPMLVLCLRVAGRRWPWPERALWLFTLAGLVLAQLGSAGQQGLVITVWSFVYLAALIALLVMLARTQIARRGWLLWMFAFAIVLVVLLNSHDVARWMGWIDYDSLTLAHFHISLVLLAIGATIIDRHFRAVAAVERAKAELEDKVAQKTREIEASFKLVEEAERAQSLARERQRIMADMHDGLGSSLVSLLGTVQSGRPSLAEVERRLVDALQELRLMVDALEPVDGDLGVVLGNVRHRMRSAIEDSGVRLHWQVGELPLVTDLTPRAILAVQRIVLEALTNALRHSRAGAVRVSARAQDGWLRIQVDDDGVGFDEINAPRGRGLDSLRRRAAGLGGALEIQSARGAGVSVILRLPLRIEPAAPLRFEKLLSS